MTAASFDAIVPAGGLSRRFGSDKSAAELGGMTLLDRVLAALVGAATVVVVGDERPTGRPVTWRREHPAYAGPAAAVAVGLTAVTADTTILLAADLPFMTATVVDRLMGAIDGRGAVLIDETGQEQWLASAWPTTRLRHAALVPGGSLRRALSALDPVMLPADRRTVLDCDTVTDLTRAEEWL